MAPALPPPVFQSSAVPEPHGSPPNPPQTSSESTTIHSLPTSPQTSSESTIIHSLPAEVLLLIASHLTYPSTHILRFAHPFFYHALPANPPTYAELIAAELTSLATKLGLLGCTGCLRMLPAHWFRASQSAHARGYSSGSRQCYRCEYQCIQHWRSFHAMPLADTQPQEASLPGPEGWRALPGYCKLCWAPLVESDVLKRKRSCYCVESTEVGSRQSVERVFRPISAEEWARRWRMSRKRDG